MFVDVEQNTHHLNKPIGPINRIGKKAEITSQRSQQQQKYNNNSNDGDDDGDDDNREAARLITSSGNYCSSLTMKLVVVELKLLEGGQVSNGSWNSPCEETIKKGRSAIVSKMISPNTAFCMYLSA